MPESEIRRLLEKLLRPARILVVEDDLNYGRIFAQWLRERFVCEVILAASGETAVQYLKEAPNYDLALVDLHLPGISGLEVARHIAENEHPIPVVFVTADSRQLNDVQGLVSYISKPMAPEEFFRIFKLFKVPVRTHEDQAYFNEAG